MKKRAEFIVSLLAEAKGQMQSNKIHLTYLHSLVKAWESFSKKAGEKAMDDPTGVDLIVAIEATIDALIKSIDQKELLAAIGKIKIHSKINLLIRY